MMRNEKKGMAFLLAVALCLPLVGWIGETQASGLSADEMPVQDKNEAAKECYMDFLNGREVVTTSEAYRQVEGGYNGNSPAYGTYSYQELKYAVAEEVMGDSAARYTFLDIDGDGAEDLLVLRFENENPSLLNWTGIIHYEEGELTLTYSYVDGYRTIEELFTSGCLLLEGASGAGIYGKNGIRFTEDGTVIRLYESCDYWGSFASCIYYQLEESKGNPLEGKYANLSPDFYVNTYSDENGFKAYVEYTKDAEPEARALEEAFAQDLVDMGGQLVDEETLRLCLDQAEKDCTEEVTWTDFADGLLPYYNAEVTACYPEEWWFNFYSEYEEAVLDSTEYAVLVAVETTKPVTDVQVVSLEISDYTENGLVCSTTELFSLPELTPEKPLLITLAFPGDLPSSGVTFVDTFGNKRLFTFCQSGMDGSLIFEEAELG